MDFNDIISVDLKELQPEYRKNGFIIKDKEAETVVMSVYRHWIVGINGVGYGVPTQHMFSDNGTEFTSDVSEELSKLLGIDWRYNPSHSPPSNGSCERIP